MGRRWTDKEKQFVIEHYQTQTATWIANKLGKYPSRVSSYATGILKLKKKMKNIKEEEPIYIYFD